MLHCILTKQLLELQLSYVVMIALNAYYTVFHTASAQRNYAHSYVQPDGLTFSIWFPIYLLLGLLCLFGARNKDALCKSTQTLSIAFLLNGAWLAVNVSAVENGNSFWGAVFLLALYAMALGKAYLDVGVDYSSQHHPIGTKLTVFAPISLALAWALPAFAVNFSNTAMAHGKTDFSKSDHRCDLGGPDWAMGVALALSVLALIAARVKKDFVLSAGVAWALAGIARAQSKGSDFPLKRNDALGNLASNASLVLLAVSVLTLISVVLAALCEMRATAAENDEKRRGLL